MQNVIMNGRKKKFFLFHLETLVKLISQSEKNCKGTLFGVIQLDTEIFLFSFYNLMRLFLTLCIIMTFLKKSNFIGSHKKIKFFF